MNWWVIPAMAILALPAPSWSQFKEPVLTNIVSGVGSDWGATFSSDMLEVYWIADPLDTVGDFDVWWARRESIDAPWQNSQPLGIVDSNRTENMPHLSYDGLTLTFSSNGREGGYGGLDLWQSTRANRDAPWQEPVNMGSTINTPGSDGGATFSADGLELIYTNGCTVPLNVNCRPSPMRRSTRESLDGEWSTPEQMTGSGRGDQLSSVYHPSLSIDGLSLYYSAPGSNGPSDVFVSKRPSLDALFGTKENLGEPINTRRTDTVVRIAADHSLYYIRDWIAAGQHGLRIWRAEADLVYVGDVNLDGEVNGLDVDPFVGLVTGGDYQAEGDMNEDGEVNGLDVDSFVAAVVGGGAQAVPEPSTCALLLLSLASVGLWCRQR
jgi:hypothetical protein